MYNMYSENGELTMICKSCNFNDVPAARVAIGYTVCLECGEQEARRELQRKSKRVAIAFNKGAYQYITPGTNLADLG